MRAVILRARDSGFGAPGELFGQRREADRGYTAALGITFFATMHKKCLGGLKVVKCDPKATVDGRRQAVRLAYSAKVMSTAKESWSLALSSMRMTEAAATLSNRNLLSST